MFENSRFSASLPAFGVVTFFILALLVVIKGLVSCLQIFACLLFRRRITVVPLGLWVFFFWLRWVFIAALGLSLVAASGGYFLLQCVGFSLRWLLIVEHGL